MTDEFLSGSTVVTGHEGTKIEAYAATPTTATGAGGIVVVHHMPGFDEATKEIVRRFASWGYAAVSPNLHHRDAPGAAPDDAAAANRANGGVSDEQLVEDVRGAVDRLRAIEGANGKVAVIGYLLRRPAEPPGRLFAGCRRSHRLLRRLRARPPARGQPDDGDQLG